MECPPSLSTFPGTIDHIQHPPEYLLLAQSGHPNGISRCPLLGVKRTSTAFIDLDLDSPLNEIYSHVAFSI
jgi:hypothetical protein